MEGFLKLVISRVDDVDYWQNRIGVPVAVVNAMALANTNVCNMMSALWDLYIKPLRKEDLCPILTSGSIKEGDLKPDVNIGASSLLPSLSVNSKQAPKESYSMIKGVTYFVGGISVSVDWMLSVMTLMFLADKLQFSDPSESRRNEIIICTLILIPSTLRSVLYTLYSKAIKNGVPMLGKSLHSLFSCDKKGQASTKNSVRQENGNGVV